MNANYHAKLQKARQAIQDAETILIGGGAGLSASAGLLYEACHQTLYDNEEKIRQMVSEQSDCHIPSALVPKCPRCGESMEPNLRKDQFFVEDDAWHQASRRYSQFVDGLGDKPLVLLELGVGYNTPTIIKFPFERLTAQHPNATLVRVNKDYPEVSPMKQTKTIALNQDVGEVLAALDNATCHGESSNTATPT